MEMERREGREDRVVYFKSMETFLLPKREGRTKTDVADRLQKTAAIISTPKSMPVVVIPSHTDSGFSHVACLGHRASAHRTQEET